MRSVSRSVDTGTGRERFAAGRFLPRVDTNRTLAPGTLESGSRPEQVWTRPMIAYQVVHSVAGWIKCNICDHQE